MLRGSNGIGVFQRRLARACPRGLPIAERRALRVAWAIVACSVAGGAGCTLLADFPDRASPVCDGGACVDATVTLQDSAAPDAQVVDAGADLADARSDGSPTTGCSGLKSGTYCANDGLHGYGGAPSDLVVCDGGAIASVKACDAGCLAMTNPFPDTCNECNTKANGLYCGRDFAGFPVANADFLIQCQATNAVQIVACAHGCRSKTATTPAACAP